MTIYKRLVLTSAILLVAVLAACTVSTEDFAAEVQYHIEEELQNSGIIVKSFTLTGQVQKLL